MKVDTHCHLLPGIDDGARSLAETLLMAKSLVELGYGTIAVTPHIRPGFWLNEPLQITAHVEAIQLHLNEAKIPLQLIPGAEHFFDPELEQRLSPETCWGKQRRFFLVELPHGQLPPKFMPDVFFRMRVKGYKIILAHPERYLNPQLWLNDLREQGILAQISLTSLGGKFGRTSQQLAQKLVLAGLVDLLATDAHRVEDVQAAGEALLWLEKNIGKEKTEKLTEVTPQKLLTT
jgi:protein-tyrosine phosphatase